jgi:molecular chaperone GrpE (heat shock protein)
MKTIGAKIDALHELREQKRELEEQVKAIAQSMQSLEDDLIKQLDAQGVSKSTRLHASVSIST